MNSKFNTKTRYRNEDENNFLDVLSGQKGSRILILIQNLIPTCTPKRFLSDAKLFELFLVASFCSTDNSISILWELYSLINFLGKPESLMFGGENKLMKNVSSVFQPLNRFCLRRPFANHQVH